jgi:hypothetical protein
VKISHASLNRHDLFTLRGITAHPEGISFPMILGNDGVGTLDDGTPVVISCPRQRRLAARRRDGRSTLEYLQAAIHSYSLSLRYKLRNMPVAVLEIAPPWVQTDLLNSSNEPRAMPLGEFIAETVKVLGTDAEEVLVEQAKPLRNNARPAD